MKSLSSPLGWFAFVSMTLSVGFASSEASGSERGGPRVMQQGLIAHYFKDPDEWSGNWVDPNKPVVDPKGWTFREYSYSRKEPLINHLFIRQGWFSVRWTGYLKVAPAVTPGSGRARGDAGSYEINFELWMDDGARLFIDGQELINDWRDCAETSPDSHRRASVKLSSGYHKLVVEYFQGLSMNNNDPDPAKFYWSCEALKIPEQIVPASHLFHDANDEDDYIPSQGLYTGEPTPPVIRPAATASAHARTSAAHAGAKSAKSASQESPEEADRHLKIAEDADLARDFIKEVEELSNVTRQFPDTPASETAHRRLNRLKAQPEVAGSIELAQAEAAEAAGDVAKAHSAYAAIAENPRYKGSVAAFKAQRKVEGFQKNSDSQPPGNAPNEALADKECPKLLAAVKNFLMNKMTEKAKEKLRAIVQKFPGTKYALEAQKQLDDLQ